MIAELVGFLVDHCFFVVSWVAVEPLYFCLIEVTILDTSYPDGLENGGNVLVDWRSLPIFSFVHQKI